MTYNTKMAQRKKLDVTKRTVVGKKVKKLRKEGFLPANIYGKDVKSLAVQVKLKEFDTLFKEVGETGLIDVAVGTDLRPVLIHNVQIDHLTRLPLHADFYQVNLKEKVKTMVGLETVGEPKAVTEKIGLLMQTLSEVEVEALPEDLPEKIEVNVEPLAAIEQHLTVGDLKVGQGVTVLTDPGQVVVKIGELVSKEAQEQAAAEAAAAQALKAEAVAAEGAGGTPAEGAAEGEAKPGEGEDKQPEQAPQEEKKEEKPQQ